MPGVKPEIDVEKVVKRAVQALGIDPLAGLVIGDALSERGPAMDSGAGNLVLRVTDAQAASRIRETAAGVFPGDYEAVVISDGDSAVRRIPLNRLEQAGGFGPEACIYLKPAEDGEMAARPSFHSRGKNSALYPLDPIVGVMQQLRGESGCPWDRSQTHHTLKPYLVEESYEVWEAIDAGNMDKLCDELGDVLLQIIFHAQLAAENGAFDVNDVVQAVTAKMIRRHPHVFGETVVRGVGDVLVNWEAIKRSEMGTEERPSVLDGVPRHLPSLAVAQKLQAKAARVGFDWERIDDVIRKVWEEAREVRDAYREAEGGGEEEQKNLEAEFGDLLFAAVNLARFLGVNAETALRHAVDKFEHRFRYIEAQASEQGRQLSEMTLAEMDELWEKAKKVEVSSRKGESRI